MQVDLGEGTVHPNHQENRLAYAQRVIAFLDKHVPSAKAGNLAAMNDATWYRIARQAGEERMPSKATISCVIGMVFMREQMLAQLATFAGNGERLLSKLEPVDREAELV